MCWTRPFRTLVPLLVLAGTPAAVAAQATGAEPYSGEAWIAERQQRHVRFENDGTARDEATVRVRIQSDAGVRQFGQLVESYSSSLGRVEFKSVRVSKPDGSVRAVPLEGVIEVASP